MKKISTFVLSICVAFVLVGCQSAFGPRDLGNATGVSIYLGYNRVADKQGDDFKQAAAKLWETIQLIETYDDLSESLDEITKMFDVCINNSNLTPEEKALCVMLKKRVTDKVGEVLANKLESNADATEFLLGVREGIATMVSMQP